MKNIVLIKLGGSVITNKKIAYSARKSVIRRLAKELKQGKQNIILAHGSGSFGHTSAAKFGGKKGYKSKKGIAKVALDALSINKIIMDILIDEGIPAISLRPMSMILAKNGKMDKNFFEVVEIVLQQGLIPVVYGDVIWDKKWKSTIFSGETTLSYIAKNLIKKNLKINKIIEVGDTKGIYNKKDETIPKITKKSWRKIKKYISRPKVTDVTGGMTHKIEEALKMSKIGVKTLLINGNKKNELSNALKGKKVEGTLIQ